MAKIEAVPAPILPRYDPDEPYKWGKLPVDSLSKTIYEREMIARRLDSRQRDDLKHLEHVEKLNADLHEELSLLTSQYKDTLFQYQQQINELRLAVSYRDDALKEAHKTRVLLIEEIDRLKRESFTAKKATFLALREKIKEQEDEMGRLKGLLLLKEKWGK
jgi:hypothetical protein